MQIRDLQPDDIPNCVELFKLVASGEDWNDMIDDFAEQELWPMFREGQYVKPHYFVCEVDGKLVGIAGYSKSGFDNEIYDLFWAIVHPEYQNQGIGGKLTETRINRIRELGGTVILSTTRKDWHLKRFGFEIIQPIKDGYYFMKLNMME